MERSPVLANVVFRAVMDVHVVTVSSSVAAEIPCNTAKSSYAILLTTFYVHIYERYLAKPNIIFDKLVKQVKRLWHGKILSYKAVRQSFQKSKKKNYFFFLQYFCTHIHIFINYKPQTFCLDILYVNMILNKVYKLQGPIETNTRYF